MKEPKIIILSDSLIILFAYGYSLSHYERPYLKYIIILLYQIFTVISSVLCYLVINAKKHSHYM